MRRLIVFASLIACSQDYNISAEPPVVNPEDVTECGFTAVEGTAFKRYDCNPVFSDTNEDWSDGIRSTGFHAEVVMGHPFYQMWYTANATQGSGNYDLGYAISADGTDWEPLNLNPLLTVETPTWRRDGMDGITVVWDSDASQYAMTYQGLNLQTGDNGLGIMTSEDGQRWVAANGDQPVIDLSTGVNGVSYCWPLALTHRPGEGFQGYIAGGPENLNCQIYGYSGATVDTMVPDPTPLLTSGPGAYDQEGVVSAAVVELEGTWYMFYSGIERWEPIPGTNFLTATNTTFNVATSPDGLNWTKSPDNPLARMAMTSNPARVGSIAAQVVGPRIHLWIDDTYEDTRATGYFLFEPNPIEGEE